MARFDKVIPPGQEGAIVLEIDGKKVRGTFSKSATVLSNDPKRKSMTISIRGTVKRYVDIKPFDRIHLKGPYGKKVQEEITIISNEDKKFEIEKIESNIDDKITYKVVPGKNPNEYKVKIWKNPKMPVMDTWGSIYLYTNSEHAPKKVIQVNLKTTGAIFTYPNFINFGTITPPSSEDEKPIEKTITVSKASGSFKIKGLRFSSDRYKGEVEPLDKGKKYKVTVRFYPETRRRGYRDEMIISTDDPREPVVRVRIIARAI